MPNPIVYLVVAIAIVGLASDKPAGATEMLRCALARRCGMRLGTRSKIMEDHRRLVVSLFEQGKTIQEIARQCGVTSAGIGRRIKEWRGGPISTAEAKGKK